MNRFLLDCSVAIAWFFADEVTEYSELVLEKLISGNDMAIVPALWELEVANVLLSKIKRKFISFPQATEILSKLRELNIEVVASTRHPKFEDILPLAHEEKLSSYDATYLHMALSENIPLASLDKDLCRAAKRVGVGLAFGRS